MILVGTPLYHFTPRDQFSGRPSLLTSVYGAWTAMLAQPIVELPRSWHLVLLQALYPVFGFILIGEGVVRLALLLVSRRQGEKEWMQVMASTYRDHIVLCGLGHLGYRVFEHLVASNVDVVVVEIDANNRFLAPRPRDGRLHPHPRHEGRPGADRRGHRARGCGRHRDQTTTWPIWRWRSIRGGSTRTSASCCGCSTSRSPPKIAGAMTIDAAFSASALAAPIVAAMSLRARVASTVIGGVPHMITELVVEPASPLAGQRIDQIELSYATKILARTPRDGAAQSPPSPATTVAAGDALVAHTAASRLTGLATAAAGAAS